MRTTFDKAYYDRFYRNPRTRAVSPAGASRQASFIASYLKYQELPVKRILDLGCGVGNTLRALQKAFPQARAHGVEYSDYLCRRYGWERGSVTDYQSDEPYDLVLCNDVLAYLDDGACARAIVNIARLCRGAAFLGILTREDSALYDRQRTDPKQWLRPAAWYRRRLGRHFLNVGSGLHLKRPVPVVLWHLDQPCG